jgi:uncharacterized RDD family membrane protein YckC
VTTAAPIPSEARGYQGHRAGPVTRVAASALDAVVVGVLIAAGYLTLVGVIWLLDPRGFHLPNTSTIFNLTVVLATLTGYLALGWATTGRTYGAHVMGLRVVDHRGRRLPVLTALARAGFCTVFPIGLLWCAVNRNNRSVQDVVLRTSVVHDWSRHAPWARLPGTAAPGGVEQA